MFVVEIEYREYDGLDENEIVGSFRQYQSAADFADKINEYAARYNNDERYVHASPRRIYPPAVRLLRSRVRGWIESGDLA